MSLKSRTPLGRTSGLRSAGIKRTGWIKRGTKPMPKSNPRQVAKRKVRQRTKHAAYMRSETRKIVDARAGGQCEAEMQRGFHIGGSVPESIFPWHRCPVTEGLQHHHKTYARYGGKELPEDMAVLCKAHHEYFESLHPTRHLAHHGAEQ